MEKLAFYTYLERNSKIYFLEFSLDQGKYNFVGQYDRFVDDGECIVLTEDYYPCFTAVFVNVQKVYKAIKGDFVGFGQGLIFFEDEQKNLFSLAPDRTITQVAEPSQEFPGKWQKGNLVFSVEKNRIKIQKTH